MHYVYLLQVDQKGGKKYYIGCTEDLKKRLEQHTKGMVRTTKLRNPKLIYYESFSTKYLAYKREKSLKNSGSVYNSLLKRLDLK